MNNSNRTIGIMGAMQEEIEDIVTLLGETTVHVIGMRKYLVGKINQTDVVLVFSRWGKVAAATTATTLINNFQVTEIFFTGVAGAIVDSLNVGDIVIGRKLFQHDMDARPMMQQFEIPLLGKTFFESSEEQIERIQTMIKNEFDNNHGKIFSDDSLAKFNISKPKVLIGDIASGDHFFSTSSAKEKLSKVLPSVLCVEMEGAAVAQVCHEYNIPFIIIRTISDSSDKNSAIDFPAFIKNIAGKYSSTIVKAILKG